MFLLKLRSALEVDFLNWSISVQTQNYAWSRLSKLMHLFSNSVPEVDFQNWYIYFQSKKYSWCTLNICIINVQTQKYTRECKEFLKAANLVLMH